MRNIGKSSWSVLNVVYLKDAFEPTHKHFLTLKGDTVPLEVVESIKQAFDALCERQSLQLNVEELKDNLHSIRHEKAKIEQEVLNMEYGLEVLGDRAPESAAAQASLLTRAAVLNGIASKQSTVHPNDIVVVLIGRDAQQRLADKRSSNILRKMNAIISRDDTILFSNREHEAHDQ